MLRTIIEHKCTDDLWAPVFPLWFGEPTDPWFAYGMDVQLGTALKKAGATVVTDCLPDYSEDVLNVDGTADWYFAGINELLESGIGNQYQVLDSLLRAIKFDLEEEGVSLEKYRVMFYRPLLLELK